MKPVTITVAISAADALAAQGDEANIVIQNYRDGAWIPLATTVDFGASTATAQVDRLSIFALTVREPEPASIPPATPVPTPTPTAAATQVPTAAALRFEFLRTWGSPGGGAGQFGTVHSVAVDGAGNVYVTDVGNGRVQVFDGTGRFLDQLGSRATLPATGSIAVDGAGNVYVTVYGDQIQVFDETGHFLRQWGSQGTAAGQFREPSSIVVDRSGDIYVADLGNGRVQVFDPTGRFLRQWNTRGTGGTEFQPEIAVDGSGNVHAVDKVHSGVQKFDGDGKLVAQWGARGTAAGRFRDPTGIAVDQAGRVYVADSFNNRVQVFTSDGQFQRPTGIAWTWRETSTWLTQIIIGYRYSHSPARPPRFHRGQRRHPHRRLLLLLLLPRPCPRPRPRQLRRLRLHLVRRQHPRLHLRRSLLRTEELPSPQTETAIERYML